MNATTPLRPVIVSGYDHNGVRRLMPISDRELTRTETFIRRVLRAERPQRGRFALIIATVNDAPHIMAFERALMSMGFVCCNSEASPYDGARIESTIRRFDIALVAYVTPTVLNAIRSAGFDPAVLFQGKTVWAAGAAYDELRETSGIDLRRWIVLGPALAIEGKHGGGAHIDGREWHIEQAPGAVYVSSRLDRIESFDRLRIDLPISLNTAPCPSGAHGPRLVL